MKYLLFCFTILFFISSSAQDCTQEKLLLLPGTWKKGPQGSIHDVIASDLTREKVIMANIHKMIETDYKPTGCQIDYSTAYGKYSDPGQKWISDPYSYTMFVLSYLCDPNDKEKLKHYVQISTSTKVTVSANVIWALDNLYASDMEGAFRGYLKLKQKPVKKNGYWFMGEELRGKTGTTSEEKFFHWLITYNDTLPFYYVSRKEYLLIQKKRLEEKSKEVPGEKEYNEPFLKNISDYLTKPESELSKPAICRWNEEERFEKFVEEGSLGSFYAIKPNLDYYNNKLPKSSPQFISIEYFLATGYPVYVENIANIEKALDFAKLKSMLGK